MIIKYETTPIDFLRNDSWECDDLYIDIVAANKEAEFNAHIEEAFPNGATRTELNDYCRFDARTIREMIGLADDEYNED